MYVSFPACKSHDTHVTMDNQVVSIKGLRYISDEKTIAHYGTQASL